MPFTIGDVDKHNKGLSPKQKDVWVKVANSALSDCERKGLSDCDASAIKQANSVVSRNLTELGFEVFADMFDKFEKEYTGMGYEYTINFFEKSDEAHKYKIDNQTFNIKGVEIFSEGKWNGDVYTKKDLADMVNAFDRVGFEPPLKFGHNSEQEKEMDGNPALGWIDKIYTRGGKLVADFKEMPMQVYQAIKDKKYKNISSEIYWNYSSNNKSFRRVLRAVALLGADIPAVTNLKPIEGLYDDANNEYRDYSILKDDNKQTEEERRSEMEDKEKIAELTEKIETDAKLKVAEDAKTAELTKQLEDAKRELEEGNERVKGVEVNAYIDDLKKGGKILPSFEASLHSLLMSAESDAKVVCHSYTDDKTKKKVELSQKETIEAIFAVMPKLVEYKEVSGNGDGDEKEYANVGAEVDEKVKAHMAEHFTKTGDKMEYSNAMKAVLDSDNDLKNAYLNKTN